MSRFIDTTAAVRSHAAGRSQSLAELQNRQGVERAAEQQRMANEELAMRQQQMVLAQQEQARQRMIDEGVANVFREQYSRLLGPSPVAPGGVGPVQPDGLEDFRGSIATAPLPVLRAMGPFISNRAKLNELMKRLPELEKQRSMIAPDSPLRLILDHMIDNVRVGDTEGFEQAARQFVTARVKAKEGEQKAAETAQQREAGVASLMRTEKWGRQEAEDFYDQKESGLRNQLRNSGDGQIEPLAPEKIKAHPVMQALGRRIKQIETDIYEVEKAAPPNADRQIQLLNQTLNAAVDEYDRAYAEFYNRQRPLMGSAPSGPTLPQTTSTTPAPGAPSGGPISQDDDRAVEVYNQLSQKLGRPPTDDELLAAGVQP